MTERDTRECSWCHSMVETPCTTTIECKACPEPWTLTPAQTAQFRQIMGERAARRATPLPIEDD